MRYNLANHCNDSLSAKLHEGAFISVVYFNMEKVLLYWSVDQYNNVQKLWIGKKVAMLLYYVTRKKERKKDRKKERKKSIAKRMKDKNKENIERKRMNCQTERRI